MLPLLDLAYLAGILLNSITMYPDGDTLVPLEKDAVVQMSYYREWWREDGKCEFKGVLVPYTRTWPEEVQRGGDTAILPPEPDKIAGYVGVVNRKACKDKPEEAILRAGLARPHKPFFGELHIDKASFFPAGDMLDPAAQIPPWLPQVVERMEMLAPKNEVARSFLDASALELAKVLPARGRGLKPADETQGSAH